MVFAKENNRTVGNKVAILQSKRLYPIVGEIAAETPEDYQIGMGRLVSDRITATSLTQAKTFQFTGESKYKTLAKDDRQYKAIAEYESTLQIPVHYLLYNPWVVPSAYSFPLEAEPALGAKANGGCRIIPASSIRACLMPKNVNYTPRFNDLKGVVSPAAAHEHGWRIEHFATNLLMKCKEGHVFESVNEEPMFNLFNRRSGPIAAAIAITVESVQQA